MITVVKCVESRTRTFLKHGCCGITRTYAIEKVSGCSVKSRTFRMCSIKWICSIKWMCSRKLFTEYAHNVNLRQSPLEQKRIEMAKAYRFQ